MFVGVDWLFGLSLVLVVVCFTAAAKEDFEKGFFNADFAHVLLGLGFVLSWARGFGQEALLFGLGTWLVCGLLWFFGKLGIGDVLLLTGASLALPFPVFGGPVGLNVLVNGASLAVFRKGEFNFVPYLLAGLYLTLACWALGF